MLGGDVACTTFKSSWKQMKAVDIASEELRQNNKSEWYPRRDISWYRKGLLPERVVAV